MIDTSKGCKKKYSLQLACTGYHREQSEHHRQWKRKSLENEDCANIENTGSEDDQRVE